MKNERSSMGEAWKPWVGGTIAGASMAMVGHPFDTLKTRMQAVSTSGSTVQEARALVREEGAAALWKGLPASLCLSALTSGIRMGCQASFNATLAQAMGRTDFRDLGARCAMTP